MKKLMLAVTAALLLCSSTVYAEVYAKSPEVCKENGYDRGVEQVVGPWKGWYRCLCNATPKQISRDLKINNLMVKNIAPEGMLSTEIKSATVKSDASSNLGTSSTRREAPGQSSNVWNLGTLQSGMTYPTSITVQNVSCKGKHKFTFTVANSAWLKAAVPKTLKSVQMGESRIVYLLIDLRNVPPGEYDSKIAIKCTSCPPPPKCVQDVSLLVAHLVVK
jgi:hypothetical protein